MENNFLITNCDTDSISFCKADMKTFSEEERKNVVKAINDAAPDFMNWADDGYFSSFIVLKAKNYIMKDEKGQVRLKGSSLKSSTLEPAVKAFINEVIAYLINTEVVKNDDLIEIYHKHVKLSQAITDIKPWCSKKTLSATTYASERENEAKIIRAIQGTDYVEGDKVWCFYLENGELQLVERFNGNYDKVKMVQKLFNATKRFSTVLDKDIFLNYSLKGKKNRLDLLVGKITEAEFLELTAPKVKKAKKKNE